MSVGKQQKKRNTIGTTIGTATGKATDKQQATRS